MTKSDKARELIERFPMLSKKKLGEILYNENPLHFKDAEDGRNYIRGVTGSSAGTTSKITHKLIYKGPEGKRNDFSPFVLNYKNVGLLFDIHIPYHDERAINVALSYFKENQVDAIVFGGDLLDFYNLSRFDKDPEERTSTWEDIKIMLGFIDNVREAFPDTALIYKFGNHDERYENYIKQNCKEIFDFAVLSMDYLINSFGKNDEERLIASKRKVTIVTGKRVVKLGKLNIVHGHEFGKSIFSPVNPARGLYLRAKASCICGHHHQTSEHIESDINNSITGCWSVGCLSDLHPAYMPINKFNLGFARVIVTNEDNFSVENKKIMNYQIV